MILIDTSIWIDFFKGKETALPLSKLIDKNEICTNELILAELIPSIIHYQEFELKEMLNSVTKLQLNINWNEIMQLQIKNLKNGINNVGIPDLIIIQNAIDNDIKIYTSDKHFELMSKIHEFHLYKE